MCITIGSAAWAQQPQVAQVGGHVESEPRDDSIAEQRSPIATAVTPEAVRLRSPTNSAHKSLGTLGKCSITAVRSGFERLFVPLTLSR
jgi:hypothetical protein